MPFEPQWVMLHCQRPANFSIDGDIKRLTMNNAIGEKNTMHFPHSWLHKMCGAVKSTHKIDNDHDSVVLTVIKYKGAIYMLTPNQLERFPDKENLNIRNELTFIRNGVCCVE